jgi:hypothetical protein
MASEPYADTVDVRGDPAARRVLPMREPLDGIADADELLGRPFPLPSVPVPLCRWVDVIQTAEHGVEVAWNLDDTREGTPGRLALYAGTEPPSDRDLPQASDTTEHDRFAIRTAPLTEAERSLRPVTELTWQDEGLHLRLTAQGPWDLDALLALARSI